MSEEQTNNYLIISELTTGSSREDTYVKTHLYSILRGFKIKFDEHRNIISSPILAISILFDIIWKPWENLMMKKMLAIRAVGLWQEMVKVHGIFTQLRTVYEKFLSSDCVRKLSHN